jgi:hypothetical protein
MSLTGGCCAALSTGSSELYVCLGCRVLADRRNDDADQVPFTRLAGAAAEAEAERLGSLITAVEQRTDELMRAVATATTADSSGGGGGGGGGDADPPGVHRAVMVLEYYQERIARLQAAKGSLRRRLSHPGADGTGRPIISSNEKEL